MTNAFKIEFTWGIQQDKDGASISSVDAHVATESVTRTAVALFGVYTLHEGTGGWVGPSGLVEEKGLTMVIVTPSANWSVKDGYVKQLHDAIKGEFNQESVLVTITNVEQKQY